MAIDELHPVAREVLTAFASVGYFRSVRFCQIIAERDPTQCVEWAAQLIEHCVANSTPHGVVTETLSVIESLIESRDTDILPLLDDLAWQCWSSGSFDDESPFLQRAVARLAWATIGFVCVVTSSSFISQRVAISADADDDSGLATLVHQCASAIDMTFTETDDGRLMIAADFTRQMKTPS